MLCAKLIGCIALFTCENIAHIEFYLQSLLPKILAIYTIKEYSSVSLPFGCRSVRPLTVNLLSFKLFVLIAFQEVCRIPR